VDVLQAEESFGIKIPKIAGTYTGTGDLFAALFLAWSSKPGVKPHTAAEMTAATLNAVIQRTADAAAGSTKSRDKELRLVWCKEAIENPTVVFEASVKATGGSA
jgi:pyridoxine kinase